MENTTLCHIEKDGSYLMMHRIKKENDINHDKWIGVGGHCEENESPDECVRRETLEETGLRLGKIRYRGIVTFVCDECEGQYMHLFTSDDFTGELSRCEEGTLEWVPKDRVALLPIWEGDRIFLKLLAEDAPFFSLKLVYEGDRLTYAALDGEEIYKA